MDRERFSESKPVTVLDAETTITTDTTTYGVSIDTQFYKSLTVGLNIDWTTDGQIDSIGFQESSDNAVADAWADIDDSENLYYPDDFPITADDVIHVGCVAKERYVRLKIVTTGFTSGSIVLPITIGLLQDSITQPMVKESSVIADADVISPGQTGDAVTTPPKRT